MTETKTRIMAITADWLEEEVQRLVACGLTHQEAARIHNARLERHRVIDLMTRLLNEVRDGD